MKPLNNPLLAGALATLAGAIWLGAGPSAQSARGCGAASGGPAPRGAHAYFAMLAARSDCMAAYSLRDKAQLEEFKNSRRKPQRVTYDPANDPDPRRQDAAKLVVPAGKVSLGNTVRLPIGTSDGTTTLVTWDAWFGREFRFENTGIGNYKTFQFASPKDRIWFEVRTRFKQDEERQTKRAQNIRRRAAARSRNEVSATPPAGTAPAGADRDEPSQAERQKRRAARRQADTAEPEKAPAPLDKPADDGIIGMVDARGYGGQDKPFGPDVTNSAPLSPQVGNFAVQPETWTRYWVLIEQRANDWDLVSLWVADEHHDPVQILDRIQLSVKGSVDQFWLEYNTSSKGKGAALPERVGYARNVVMLRNLSGKDVPGLLARPVR
jgi:hypothetical protein